MLINTTIVFRQLSGTDNYSYSVKRWQLWKHLSNSIDEELEPIRTRSYSLQNSNRIRKYFKVLRTRTESNHYHQRTV